MAVSVEVRAIIVHHHRQGRSVSDIASFTNLKYTTVYGFLRRWKEGGELRDRPRTGRPRLVDNRKQNLIKRVARVNPSLSANAIWIEARDINDGRTPSRHTLARILHRCNLFSFRARRTPLLTKQHRRTRLVFAKNHKSTDWNRVIFSDEKRFRFHTDRPVRVWRHPGEGRCARFQRPTVKFGGGSVMVWVAIRSDGKLWIRRCHDHMTGVDYMWMLDDVMEDPTFSEALTNGPMILQQDNASPHRMRGTLEYLDAIGFPVMEWPSQSPDLNIVEHIWPLISRQLPKRTFRNKDDAWLAVKDACANLDGSASIRDLYESIPRRLDDCVMNHGGPTRY